MSPESFNSLALCLLVYDVPQRSGVANPSGRLRRIAFRINLSCWVIRRTDIPYAYLNRLAEKGVVWRVVSFDASEAESLVALGIENIRKEIRDAIVRARRSESRAARDLEANQNDKTSQDDYAKAARANIRRLRKLLSDLEAAAKRFGITAGQLSLSEARNVVDGINKAMREKCRVYAEMAETIRRTYVSGAQAMARAVERDEVPAGIAADFLRDHGEDAKADQVNSLFV